MEKLEHWADDLKDGIERELKELESEIRATKKDARLATTLDAKVVGQKRVKELEKQLKEKRTKRDEAQDEIEVRKDRLIENVEAQLRQQSGLQELFSVRWRVI